MSRMPTQQGPVVEVKPQPNVYTLLLVIAILALAGAIAYACYVLMSEPPVGYGMKFGQMFGK